MTALSRVNADSRRDTQVAGRVCQVVDGCCRLPAGSLRQRMGIGRQQMPVFVTTFDVGDRCFDEIRDREIGCVDVRQGSPSQ